MYMGSWAGRDLEPVASCVFNGLIGAAATMVTDKDSLIREVDEDLRREQLEKLWDRYGTYILIGAALIVFGVGGYKWYENRGIQQARANGVRFEQALRLGQTGKAEDGQKELASLAKSAPGGYRTLAELRLAGADAAAGKRAEAVLAYEKVAGDRSVDVILRDYAQVAAAMLRVNEADWTEMENRLKVIEASENPWRASARELLGMAAWKSGKTDEARKRFEALLVDRNVSQNISQRAQMMMSLIAEAEAGIKPDLSAPAQVQPAANEVAAPAAAETVKPAAETPAQKAGRKKK